MRLFDSESYTLPIAVSVVLHAGILYFITVGFQTQAAERKIQMPKFVPATLVQMEKTAPKAIPKPQPRTIDRVAEQRERERLKKAEEAKRQQEVAKKQQAEKEKQEQERKKQQEAEQQRREKELAQQRQRREQEIADALAEEEALLQSEQDAELANSYHDVIYNRVVRNWSQPPSARNGMVCVVRVQLVPTGRVVDVTIVKGSGNSAFDRSAEQAIWKAEQFPELKDLPSTVFEKYFRSFNFKFDPSDLRL